MQSRKLQQVDRNIWYLRRRLKKQRLHDIECFCKREEQIKNKMLAEASPEYVFETVSPAMVLRRNHSQKGL